MRIIFASDHAGFEHKEHLKHMFVSLGYDVEDVGPYVLNEGDDYPDFIGNAARKVSDDLTGETRGIILGGSGQGEAIVANRFPRVRAVVYTGEPSSSPHEYTLLKLTREHNDANMLSLGARFLTPEACEQAVRVWLETPFSQDERHVRRIQKIESVTE